MPIERRMKPINKPVSVSGNEAGFGVRLIKARESASDDAETDVSHIYWTNAQTLDDWFTDIEGTHLPPYTNVDAVVYTCDCSWTLDYHGQIAVARIFDHSVVPVQSKHFLALLHFPSGTGFDLPHFCRSS